MRKDLVELIVPTVQFGNAVGKDEVIRLTCLALSLAAVLMLLKFTGDGGSPSILGSRQASPVPRALVYVGDRPPRTLGSRPLKETSKHLFPPTRTSDRTLTHIFHKGGVNRIWQVRRNVTYPAFLL